MFIDKDKDHFKHGINQWTGEPNKPVFYNAEMAKKIRELNKPVNDFKVEMVKKIIESYGVRCELEGKPSDRVS